jgi:hypothetical protein
LRPEGSSGKQSAALFFLSGNQVFCHFLQLSHCFQSHKITGCYFPTASKEKLEKAYEAPQSRNNQLDVGRTSAGWLPSLGTDGREAGRT